MSAYHELERCAPCGTVQLVSCADCGVEMCLRCYDNHECEAARASESTSEVG